MRIIDTDKTFTYILADSSKLIKYKNIWGIGVLVKKEEVNNVTEISEQEIINFLKSQDDILAKY